MSDFIIGVDGGGTLTRALLVSSDDREVAKAEGPASLAIPSKPEKAAKVIAGVVEHVAEKAGVPLPVQALHAAVAGVGRETTRSGVQQALDRLGLARLVRVGTDVEATYYDAFKDGPGILLVSGTGSVAWGRLEDGRTARVGGWGSLIGDEGSGYGIGLECLKRVARSVDGRGPETRLQQALMDFIELEKVEELIVWAHDATKADIAALVPVVVEQARAADAVAGEILVKAVEELEGHVLTLLENLGPWKEPPRVALAGGLLEPGGPLREPTERVLTRHQLIRVDFQPHAIRGAVGLARQLMEEGG